ncbi:DUF2249 domain-containing protein [Massilia oculi]|uniref:DUF2249 domain-containing protein n=1 Tax=Massilia oculi TaxID=945844 RepID=UPI0028AFE293|nr:DUF2249 domain-containing protein [Massilia oculi]
MNAIAAGTVRIDVSALAAPEPMERILDALAVLPPGARLQVLIHREPFPLYEILDRRGWDHRTTRRPDARYDLVIEAMACSAP